MFGRDFLARHMKPEPLDYDFNAMVLSMADRINPNGFKVLDSYVKTPRSLADLNAYINGSNQVPVWEGDAKPSTIFEDREVNLTFVSWMTSARWFAQAEYNFAGAAEVGYLMCWQMFQQYGDDDTVTAWASYILALTVGVAQFHSLTGQEPIDQREFVELTAREFLPMATKLAIEFSEEGVRYTDAIRAARRLYGKSR